MHDSLEFLHLTPTGTGQKNPKTTTTTTTSNSRGGIVSPLDLASSYATPDQRLAPISRDNPDETDAVDKDNEGEDNAEAADKHNGNKADDAVNADNGARVEAVRDEAEAVREDSGGNKYGERGRKLRAAALPPLEANVNHRKLEGAASRERREKAEQRLQRQAPPVDPPADFNMARRRGGLGKNGTQPWRR